LGEVSAWVLALVLVGGVPDDEAAVRAMYVSEPEFESKWPVEFHVRVLEGLSHRVTRQLRDLGADRSSFADTVELAWGTLPPASSIASGVQRTSWAVEATTTRSVDAAVQRLTRWLGAYRYLEQASLRIKTGTVTASGRFAATAALEVAGRTVDEEWRHDRLRLSLGFVRTAAGWRIDRWVALSGETDLGESRYFEDVTQAWLTSLPDGVRRRLLARSASDHIYETIRSGKMPPGSRAQPVAMDAHPGVVVVDIDDDGLDDLFVWDVLGPAVLLRNVGGARFEDVTARYGLDLSQVSAAAFADLDNDGDLDLVVGHWFAASKLYRGDTSSGELRFEATDVDLPKEVVTISLVDLDRDGRLEVFLGTGAHDHHARLGASGRAGDRPDANVDQLGPKNAIWSAKRGLVWLPQTRNTLQAAFTDFDGDGHQDVFLGNDFARAHLLRGDGAGGFEDVSADRGADRILFGMGASWGDFDGDGDLDLYASAMASSAGKRIMAGGFADELDARDRSARQLAARGSTLLENRGGRFVDATEAPRLAIARQTGWAYGGQFFDPDNDGWLDLYVPNGFFTAPGLAPAEVFRDL